LRQLFEHIYHTKKLIKLERKILITEKDNLFFPYQCVLVNNTSC